MSKLVLTADQSQNYAEANNYKFLILRMTNNIVIFLFSLCIQVSVISVYAQFEPAPVEKSDQKIIYKGVLYYVHTVQQGQTLYSICKAYNVSVDDIRNANQEETLDPLSVGKVLRIPMPEEDAQSATDQKIVFDNSDDFIYHTVLPKQTPYFLHSKYNVPLEAIYYYNPGTESGLQIGQVVKIPRQKLLDKKEIKEENLRDDIIRYEVKSGDTLYRIALDHNVTVSAIINANESLRWGLKPGQIIIIPTGQTVELLATESKYDSILLVTALAGLSRWQCDSIRMQKRMRPPTKVALMLPFYAREGLELDTMQIQLDSITGEIIKNMPKPIRGRGAAEFYEGFLLSVDTLRKAGHNISLFVYDTEGDTNRMDEILNELDIVEPDVIVGPFYASNVRMASKYAFKNKIPFVPPLMKDDTSIMTNPYLFQVYPSEELELIWQAKYLSQIQTYNMLLLYKPSLKNHDEILKFKQLLVNHLKSKPEFDTLQLKELIIDDSLNIKLGNTLLKDTLSYAIIFSSYEPDVISSLSQLHFHQREFPIMAFGQSIWQVFPNIRIDHFHDLETTISTPFFINYTSPGVKRFVETCREKLNYEPYKTTSIGTGLNYTFLGYDLGMYFLTSSFLFGDDICNCATNYNPELLLTTYRFMRNSSTGCFENNHINFIRYTKDYEIIEEEMVQLP